MFQTLVNFWKVWIKTNFWNTNKGIESFIIQKAFTASLSLKNCEGYDVLMLYNVNTNHIIFIEYVNRDLTFNINFRRFHESSA